MLIRISFQQNKQIDWAVPFPQQITFSDVLDAICQASDDQLIVTAFEYMDEEEDFITVKNDEDLKSMIQFHLSSIQEHQILSIYPKLSRNPGKRNKHGLKVAILEPLRQKNKFNATFSKNPGSADRKEPASHFNVKQTSISTSNCKSTLTSSSNPAESGLESLSKFTFTFLETLGSGNSGIVYKVNHKITNVIMAVKSIAIDLTGQEQDRIKSELSILSQCNSSPQIIDFYGAYFDENRIFLCTEYMDGGSLDHYGKVPETVLQRVCHRVVAGLEFLWGKRIMHRDVKPSNMLVNSRGQVKLCDFGVSRQLVNSVAQTYIGTNVYMAPERVVGCDYTIYSDIWSLGLSICEMAVGHFPYQELASKMKGSHGVVPIEVLQCIVNDAPPSLPAGQFSAEIIDFVKGCLQKEASCRTSPEVLCRHHFIAIENMSDFEDAVTANWVLLSKENT